MEETGVPPTERFYSPTAPSPKRFGRIIGIILALLVIGGVIFGVTKFIGSKKQEATPTPTPSEASPTETQAPTASATTSPTQKPTSTPTLKPTVNPIDKTTGLDRSKLSVEVLNGSGTGGVAKKAADFLLNLGYNIASTGNADRFDYDKITIETKAGKSEFLTLLKKDLSDAYSIGTTSATLSASASADARVIVGK